jgi:hypothetical protein
MKMLRKVLVPACTVILVLWFATTEMENRRLREKVTEGEGKSAALQKELDRIIGKQQSLLVARDASRKGALKYQVAPSPSLVPHRTTLQTERPAPPDLPSRAYSEQALEMSRLIRRASGAVPR